MPAQNSIKSYQCEACYHIYNRGVEKRLIFEDERDYKIFLSYLRFYLTPHLQGLSLKVISPSRQANNFAETIELYAYCLMPNHFHLLIHQTTATAINYFMRSLMTRYVCQFNRRRHRVGPLFQGRYKGVLIGSKDHLLHTTKYIHQNPLGLCSMPTRTVLEGYPYSSYLNYVGLINQSWVKTDPVLGYFNTSLPGMTYDAFVCEEVFKDCP
jgi:putative transposase